MLPALWGQQQPILQVSPTSLHFQGEVDGPLPDPQYLTIANAGGEVMEWHASADADWIILGGTEGKLSGGREIQLLVWVKTEGLEAGEHHGTVTISSPNAQGSPVNVAVTLTLTAPPRLEVTPTSLSFEAEEEGPNPEPQTIRIKNGGRGILSWEATTDADWLRLGACSGSLLGGQNTEVLVLVDISGLSAGSYGAKITINSPEARGSPAVVRVGLQLERRALRVPQDFSTIQTAIEEARSGDTIIIGPGTYTENLRIEKSLTLRGAGAGKTVIESAEEGQPVVLIKGEEIEVILEGLILTGASGDCESRPEVCPIGLVAVGSARVTLQNSRVSDNGRDGLYVLDSARVTLQDSTVSDNREDSLYVRDYARVTVEGSLIEGNGAHPRCKKGAC